jgi:maltose O-acetyltransferase
MMNNPVRKWLNQYIGIPVMLFLLRWALNRAIPNVPSTTIRYTFYRLVCGFKVPKTTALCMGAKFTGNTLNKIEIGEHSYVGYDSFWVACDTIKIADHVSVGHHVQFYTADHDPDDPAFPRRDGPIVVEDHAWIGSRATILRGVTIGRGAVVAAGSVVTKDVAPFTIVGGNPAKFLRKRGTTEFTYRHDGPPLFA